MHHSIWKNLFVLGADEYLERLEGKIRKCLFFYVKIFWNNSVIRVQNHYSLKSYHLGHFGTLGIWAPILYSCMLWFGFWFFFKLLSTYCVYRRCLIHVLNALDNLKMILFWNCTLNLTIKLQNSGVINVESNFLQGDIY